MKSLNQIEKIEIIPTNYKGCRFRSRTEARWAVFFDAAKIPWFYEPEGYSFDGIKYLPDFWLPSFNSFFEVKGGYELADDYRSLFDLFSRRIRRPILLAKGPPPRPASAFFGEEDVDGNLITVFKDYHYEDSDDPAHSDAWGECNFFLRCEGCGKIYFRESCYFKLKACCERDRLDFPYDALTAWFSARFEYGEKG